MSATAEVHRIPMRVLSGPRLPSLLTRSYAELPCGCRVYVGRRMDNAEAATGARCCSQGHVALINHFNLLLRESLVEPCGDELVAVCARLLDEAARYYGGSA